MLNVKTQMPASTLTLPDKQKLLWKSEADLLVELGFKGPSDSELNSHARQALRLVLCELAKEYRNEIGYYILPADEKKQVVHGFFADEKIIAGKTLTRKMVEEKIPAIASGNTGNLAYVVRPHEKQKQKKYADPIQNLRSKLGSYFGENPDFKAIADSEGLDKDKVRAILDPDSTFDLEKDRSPLVDVTLYRLLQYLDKTLHLRDKDRGNFRRDFLELREACNYVNSRPKKGPFVEKEIKQKPITAEEFKKRDKEIYQTRQALHDIFFTDNTTAKTPTQIALAINLTSSAANSILNPKSYTNPRGLISDGARDKLRGYLESTLKLPQEKLEQFDALYQKLRELTGYQGRLR